jgi:S-adenosylmethionine decarboxylase
MRQFGKIKLHGFNNLTKSLSFNIYAIGYAQTQIQQQAYQYHIAQQYSAENLKSILIKLANIIGADILNIAQQDYEPEGASVTMLIAEHRQPPPFSSSVLPQTVLAHLDKSHITVHTYPDNHPSIKALNIFRADIDISTCGHISPLNALNYLIQYFNADIVIMDYRVRGFTRDKQGIKHYIDHKIDSIQTYIAPEIQARYQMQDANLAKDNIFHTKMRLKNFDLEAYLINSQQKLSDVQRISIETLLKQEISDIFLGHNDVSFF